MYPRFCPIIKFHSRIQSIGIYLFSTLLDDNKNEKMFENKDKDQEGYYLKKRK
jgi:hypothetical protein